MKYFTNGVFVFTFYLWEYVIVQRSPMGLLGTTWSQHAAAVLTAAWRDNHRGGTYCRGDVSTVALVVAKGYNTL